VTRIKVLRWFLPLVVLLAATAAHGQEVQVESEPVECVPIEGNAVAWAKVENLSSDAAVRLYFRRLHDVVEDLYYVEMHPAGQGRYWGVFPKAEDRELQRHAFEREREELREEQARREEAEWAAWWKAKELSDHRDPNEELDRDLIREKASLGRLEERHWMLEMDDDELEEWLDQLENEPAEYFTAVYDPEGQRLNRSETQVVEVRSDCEVELTPQQAGVAENLTVGETAVWQKDEEIFHWLCDGVVTRIDPLRILRADEVCRVCVIAWWKKPAVLAPAAAAAITGIVVIDDDPPEIISEPEPNL